jgi:hypothetical protein
MGRAGARLMRSIRFDGLCIAVEALCLGPGRHRRPRFRNRAAFPAGGAQPTKRAYVLRPA